MRVIATLVAAAATFALLPACDLLHQSSMPQVIADGCPADENSATTPEPVKFGAMLSLMTKRGFKQSWKSTGGEAGVVDLAKIDQLTNKSTTIAMQVEHRPLSGGAAACSHGVTVITNMAVNGESMDGYELEQGLGQMIDAAREAGIEDRSGAVTPAKAVPTSRTLPSVMPLAPPTTAGKAKIPAVTEPDDDEVAGDQSFYAQRAETAAARQIIVSDDGTTWCCLTVGDVARRFSSGGASHTIDTYDDGKVNLDITDPSGRWHGWHSFELIFEPDTPGQKTPLRPSSIEVGGKQVMNDDDTADSTISGLLRQAFALRRRPVAKARFSAAYDRCLATGDAARSIQSAVNDCVSAEYQREDDRLNAAYHAKMAQLPVDRQQALRVAERAWLKDRELKCAPPSDSGTLAHDGMLYCYASETTARVSVIDRFE